MKWRVVKPEEHTAAMNMAIDEAVSNAVGKGRTPPTIRFYTWKPSAVSIGYFQGMNDEVDVERCIAKGVDVVRRRTGGGAVYHDNKGELTYSVIAPEDMFPEGITESYHLICQWIINGLLELDITAEFKPINDIIADGKKISGNAQTRRGGVLLQHGTILYDVDVDTMFSLLKVPDEKIRDKLIATVKERVTRVLDFSDVRRKEVYEAMLKGFTKGKEWEFDMLSANEIGNAERLSEERYRTREWNFKR